MIDDVFKFLVELAVYADGIKLLLEYVGVAVQIESQTNQKEAANQYSFDDQM